MKRLAMLLLSAVMILCSCAWEFDPSMESEGPLQETNTDDVYNVVMQVITFGREYEGLERVEEAINAITVPEIGVSVTLLRVDGWNLASTNAQQITSGKKIDLICVLAMGSGLDSISHYAGKNLLLPLDALYDSYGQDIDRCIGELKQLGYYSNKLYGVPVNYLAGVGGGYIVRTDLMEELGFHFEEGVVYTIEDLEPMFEAYCATYGEEHYAVASYPSQAILSVDMLGDGAAGVLMNGGLDNLDVVNLFATQEYADYISTARRWHELGYFHPNAAYITESWPMLLASGDYLGAFASFTGNDGFDGMPAWENSSGYDLTAIKIAEDVATTQVASYATWCIPVTCENPQKTMQFLNLLYQERDRQTDIDSLLAAGIEGETYQVLEEVGGSKSIVTYAEGVDYLTAPYEQAVPIYGNQMTVPKFSPLTAEIYTRFIRYNENLKERGRYSRAFGYVFDYTVVSAEQAAVRNVISQYSALLAYGVLDPKDALPEFLQDLQDAGMDAVIAENQQQLNMWADLQK